MVLNVEHFAVTINSMKELYQMTVPTK